MNERTTMKTQELTAAAFLAHLRRHPIPEILSDECLAELSVVETQYGDTITHGAGLEVRLGEEERYVDYIMNIDEEHIPYVGSLWYEIDYAEFRKASQTREKIEPCLFANVGTSSQTGDYAAFWDKVLPPFMGERRAKNLRAPLDRLTAALPEGALIKQIGTMTGRGELDIMRLVILFPIWEQVFPGLDAIGWQGDTEKLRDALEPWKEGSNVAVNIDLGEHGVLPKIGIEVFSCWRHPLLVDKFITRLEEAGLCLPSKGDALRRWIRICPDGDPFIQTLISYFKLNYKDGKITEAKAYLEQSPYIHHHYFANYERPVYVELILKDNQDALPVEEALRWLDECRENRVKQVHLSGDVAACEQVERILEKCRDSGIAAQVKLKDEISIEQLEKMIAAGADSFLVDIGDETTDISLRILNALRDLGCRNTRARFLLHGENVRKLPQVIEQTENLDVSELIITGMTPEAAHRSLLTRSDMEFAATIIKAQRKRSGEPSGEGNVPRMQLSLESCFSPLRAYLEGEDPKRNGNRGIEKGCTAGRDHFSVLPSGKVSPCAWLEPEEDAHPLSGYWTSSHRLKELREAGGQRYACRGCDYELRCLPCPCAYAAILTSVHPHNHCLFTYS